MTESDHRVETAEAGGPVFPAPPASAAFRGLVGTVRRIDQVSYWVVASAMAAMSVILAAQVVARYGFGDSIDAASELARLFFVWSIFLAIPHGIRHGVHVGIDVFVVTLPYVVQDFLFRTVALAGAALMAILLYFSLLATADKWPELMPTLPVTAGLYYVAVVIACGHSLLHLGVLVAGGPRAWEEAPE